MGKVLTPKRQSQWDGSRQSGMVEDRRSEALSPLSHALLGNGMPGAANALEYFAKEGVPGLVSQLPPYQVGKTIWRMIGISPDQQIAPAPRTLADVLKDYSK